MPEKTDHADLGDTVRAVIVRGDLSKLNPIEQVNYYNAVCRSIGLNPLTKPFEYIVLNGKLQLYALKNATDQLRQIYGVSVEIADRKVNDDVLIVHAKAKVDQTGRTDEDFGAVPLSGLVKGEARSNAIMKAVTKAKRRVTLSICGLSFLDETEIDSIPSARPAPEANANIDRAITQETNHEGKQ